MSLAFSIVLFELAMGKSHYYEENTCHLSSAIKVLRKSPRC